MAVLLQEDLCREHVCDQLLWLVHPYQEVQDTGRVTNVRRFAGLGVDVGLVQVPRGVSEMQGGGQEPLEKDGIGVQGRSEAS